MSDGTKIEWTDATWNVITGCSVLSPGCRGCYAMKLAGTRLRHHPSRAGLTQPSAAGPVWTGEVRFNAEWLDQPQRWRRPRQIFVCAHGDLFHESVPDAWIDQVFAVMQESPWHTFQVLTKRARRMREYMTAPGLQDRLGNTVMRLHDEEKLRALDDPVDTWPLPNVILMVSAERQQEADERIPELLASPAARRGVSLEPLLGPIDISRYVWPVHPSWPARYRSPEDAIAAGEKVTYHRQGLISADWAAHLVNWVIAGGESGDRARPSHPDWFRSLRDQCAAAGVPFLFKQWGAWAEAESRGASPSARPGNLCRVQTPGLPDHFIAIDTDGALATTLVKVPKRDAGRLLDGVQHDGFPT